MSEFVEDWGPLVGIVLAVPASLLAVRQFLRRGDSAPPPSPPGDDHSIEVGEAKTGNQSPQSIGGGDQLTSYGSGDNITAETVIIHKASPVQDSAPSSKKPTLMGLTRECSANFVGRESELAELEKDLLQSRQIRVTASVTGLAGIGKTELALQMVRKADRMGSFPGGIFWLNAEDTDLRDQWAAIAIRLGIVGSPDKCTAELLRQLNASTEQALVVLDNVETWPVAPIPDATNIAVLITSRDNTAGGAAFHTTELGFLDHDEARKLLGDLSGRSVDGEPWDELLEHLGGHALALELAGAYLAVYPEESPSTYLAALQEGKAIDRKVKDQTSYQATVDQALEKSWSRLPRETQRAWCLAAQFAPEFASPKLSDACGVDQEARRQLTRFHLIERGSSGWWRMHRLTRQFGLNLASEQESPSPEALFLKGCVEVAKGMDITTGLALYLPEKAQYDAAISRGSNALDHDAFMSLLNSVASALRSAGAFDQSRELYEQALVSSLETYGEDHPHVATYRSNLAGVLRVQGDLSGARELYEQALVSALETSGEDHPQVATYRNNLAVVLRAQGDLSGARELFEQALASDLETYGEDHPDVAIDRNNLAGVLQDQGDLSGARELFEQALASDLETYGEDHPMVAIRRNNLALVLEELAG